MSNDDTTPDVTIISDDAELDKLNTVAVNFSVPPNSQILVISPAADGGMLFQRQSTVIPETASEEARGAAGLMQVIMWGLANRIDIFQEMYAEMQIDWTTNIEKGLPN